MPVKGEVVENQELKNCEGITLMDSGDMKHSKYSCPDNCFKLNYLNNCFI